jgi:hypothetical protein
MQWLSTYYVMASFVLLDDSRNQVWNFKTAECNFAAIIECVLQQIIIMNNEISRELLNVAKNVLTWLKHMTIVIVLFKLK